MDYLFLSFENAWNQVVDTLQSVFIYIPKGAAFIDRFLRSAPPVFYTLLMMLIVCHFIRAILYALNS